MKYAVLSDLHCHTWSSFSTINADGVNSRLREILNEVDYAAKMLRYYHGNTMFIAGDIFHTRGTLDPEVLNPVRECFQSIILSGVKIVAIPGNHDMKTADTRELSSAIQNLKLGKHFRVVNHSEVINIDGHLFGFVPWRSDLDDLRSDLDKLARISTDMDVFIHAGIDDVLVGVPSAGLTAKELASYGFRRVYAGHYHNRRIMEGGKVVSIGAPVHHTWGDVGAEAGYIIADRDSDDMRMFGSKAPSFVDVSGLDDTDMELACPGNYVRFRGPQMTQDEINKLRKRFETWGAKGISIQVPVTTTSLHASSPVRGKTLDQSVSAFIAADKNMPASVDPAAVERAALSVLKDAVTVVDET